MKEFIAACVQIAVTPNDVQANVDKGVAWLEKAVREHEAELVVFPETATTTFVTGLETDELWDLIDDVPGRPTRDVQAAAKSLGVHVVWPTYRRGPERGIVYNSAILIGPDGDIVGIYNNTVVGIIFTVIPDVVITKVTCCLLGCRTQEGSQWFV